MGLMSLLLREKFVFDFWGGVFRVRGKLFSFFFWVCFIFVFFLDDFFMKIVVNLDGIVDFYDNLWFYK